MKLEITSEKYNRFMKRKEVDISVEHPEEATPSTASVQQLVAKQMNAEAAKVEIKEIMTSRGSPASKGLIFVWDEKIVKKDEKKPEGAEEKKGKETTEQAAEKKEMAETASH